MERLPENLIFDLGGVLIDLDVGRMLKGFEGVGLDPRMFMAESAEKGATTVCEGMSVGQLLSDYQTGDITTEELLETILPECRPGTTEEQLIEAWNHCLVDIPRERLETVRRWREKGHRTYMLSNTNDLHWRYISTRCFGGKGLGLEDCFDGVFLSHEMRLAKPDAEIYRSMLQRLGVRAEDCWFVDDAQVNVEAARKEGLQAEWLDVKNEDLTAMMQRKG
ncbi:MAG: HAD family phosphatase [Bacteroidaceae bacterium]|nr:HAD family phosphatase [Bacteroidaceae bacterium]